MARDAKLDLLQTMTRGGAQWLERNLEAPPCHRQLLHERRDAFAEPGRRRPPAARQLLRERAVICLCVRHSLRERCDIGGFFEMREPGLGLRKEIRDGLGTYAVSSRRIVNARDSLLDARQLARIDVEL